MSKSSLSGKLVGNMAFEMELDGHKLITDASPEIGGQDLGPRPKRLLFSALIGCTGIDTMSILNKMKVEVDDFDIHVEADNTEEHPKVYENINVVYSFTGKNLPKDKIEKAVKLSQERYCGVSQMLGKDRNQEIKYEIIIKES